MGRYTCRACDNSEYKDMISLLRNGYTGRDGIVHRPNNQIADVLVLEANLGCRLGDILQLKHSDFVCDNGIWKIIISEEKTDKKRTFIVPAPVKEFIDTIHYGKDDRLFKVGKQAVWKVLREITAELNLSNISSHALRKMAACAMYDKTNHDIEAVCTFLNHSSVKITRSYIRRSDKQIEDAINNIVNLM